MASNKALTKQAQELADVLKIKIPAMPTDNKSLAKLVSDLKAKKKDADTETVADNAPPAEHEGGEVGAALMESETTDDKPEATDDVLESNCHVITGGKSITTKRGILGPNQVITSEDLTGGEEALAAFVKSGHIVAAVR